MTFYPMLKAPDCSGFVTLSNFPPNNWEDRSRKNRLVHVTWPAEGKWHSKCLDELQFGKFLTLEANELQNVVPQDTLALLSLSENALPPLSETLPEPSIPSTVLPAWRAALGLRYGQAETSYQGEIVPFPDKASLLTFGPFIQPGPDIKNFMLLVSLTKSAEQRSGSLQLRDTKTNTTYTEFELKTNAVNVIDLNSLSLAEDGLPLFYSAELTGIPLYLSVDTSNKVMSMEHTHPPASLAIHGNRWAVQKKLKERWLER